MSDEWISDARMKPENNLRDAIVRIRTLEARMKEEHDQAYRAYEAQGKRLVEMTDRAEKAEAELAVVMDERDFWKNRIPLNRMDEYLVDLKECAAERESGTSDKSGTPAKGNGNNHHALPAAKPRRASSTENIEVVDHQPNPRLRRSAENQECGT